MKNNDIVHVDTNNYDWGRVCSDGYIVCCYSDGYHLVSCVSIRACIIIPEEDIVVLDRTILP